MSTPIYYHGGTNLLKVGDLVLPSAETGAVSTADYGAGAVCRRDRVYVSCDRAVAITFAAFHFSGKGRVYVVEPIGELEADPDCKTPGYSFQCVAARVLQVIEVSKKTRDRVRRTVAA